MTLKRILCLVAIVVVGPSNAADVSELGWMTGCWSIEGKETGSGEMWTRAMGNMLLGVGYMSRNGKVDSYEYLRIEKRQSGDVYFVVKPSGQSEAEFKMTEAGERRVVFENPAHDFPQRIAYRLEADGIMIARVEAEGKGEGEVKGFELTMLRSECSE